MPLPDGHPFVVADGILRESSPEGLLILWLPGERVGGYQHWERVATVARATVTTERGVRSIAATSVPARQRLGGLLGRFVHSLKGPNGERAWTLPDGATAEQCGARRTDRRLAWPADESTPLDEARIRALWPVAREIRALGRDLYLVSGFEPQQPRAVEGPGSELGAEAASQASPRELAERALGAARAAGDRRWQVTAQA